MRHILTTALLTAGFSLSASAQVYTMTFDELANYDDPADFYDGGSSAFGIGPGPDYGVVWSGAEQVLSSGGTKVSNVPSGMNFMNFGYDGEIGSAVMNVAGGFTTGVSFWYINAVSAEVWSGLNGTGTLLAQVFPNNPTTEPSCGWYCIWYPKGIAFAGVAKSVTFDGYYDVSIMDNVTIGSAVPVPVPEPATIWLSGIGVAALVGLRKLRRPNKPLKLA